MGVRKHRSVLIQYALCLAFAVFIVIAVNVGAYLFGVNKGAIYPITSISTAIEGAKDNLQSTQRIKESDIPPLCEYILFTKDGQYVGGSIDQEDGTLIWNTSIESGRTSDNLYLYSVIDREEEVLILRYRMTAQFENKTLRSIFPSADLILIIIILLEILASLIVISYIFGKYLGKKIDKLLTIVHKLEYQDLDFDIQKSKLFEVDQALDALDHMRIALKHSLSKQWQDDKMRQDQLSALAHDLKTPLTIIRGNTELLFETSLSTEQRECAEYIESSSEQMQLYIRTLIDISRAATGYQLHMEDINLPAYVEHLWGQIDALCQTKKIGLKMEADHLPAVLSADKLLLERAIMNVVNNALDYSPRDSFIHISMTGDKENLKITVTDAGPGFSQEDLRHAQEQFYMADHSRSSNLHFGMGLFITKSIVQQHGGQLILSNSEKTGGAQATISISY